MQFLLISLILPFVLGGAIPGQEKCAWGPPYWCSHVLHARECRATQHCLQTVWKNQIIKPTSVKTCTYCELIVNAFRDAIKYPNTQAEIETALSEVCTILPDADIRDMCRGIVQEYVPELIQMFEDDITTDMICATIGLCSGLEDKWSPYGVKSSNDTVCSDCTKFFTDVQQAITSNETLNQLLQLLNQTVCSELGAFSETCIDLAAQYLPIALQTLASQLDPNIVCRIFGFCSVEGAQIDAPLMNNIFANRASKDVIKYKSDEECVLCEDFVKEFDTLLKDPSEQQKLYNLIRNNFCAKTGVFIIQCHHLVDGYVPPAISMIANKLQMDPSIACKIVGLCPPVESQGNMRMMMKHMFTVRKSKTQVGNKVGDEECDICKDLFNQVDEFIRDKANQDKFIYEVKTVVCPVLGSFQDECKELVDEYAPMLFELLVNELDPSTICEEVGFCPVPSLLNVELSKVEEPAGMVGAGYVKQSEECVICQTIQVFVDNLLKKNETVKTIDDLLNKVCKRLPTELLDEHCENFVNKFGKEMIDKLANENVCQIIDVCPKPKVELKKVSDGKCQLCQLVISISESLVANVSEDVILHDLRGLCSFIPGNFSATCTTYVNEYAPLIISALKSKEDPKTLCELIKACSAQHLPYMTKPIPEILPALKAPSQECEFCNTAVVMLKFYLENKATEAELEKALDSLCKYAGNLAPLCQGLVATYGDKIIALVISELNANEICSTLKLCTEVKKQAPSLSAIMSPYDTLPAGKVMESKKVSVKSPSQECEICNTVVVMMKFYLQSNATDDEIKKAMESLCGDIPSEEISGLCVSLVDEYIGTILDLLRKELNATYICTKLGFCKDLSKQMSGVSAIMSPYDTLPLIQPVEDKKVVKSPEECELCKEGINMMKSFLKENATKDEITKVVETFCDKIPSSFKDQCDSLIKQYGDMIIDLLVQKADADKICKEIKLCTASISVIMSPYNTLPIVEHVSENKEPVNTGNAVECEFCTYIMNSLENKVQDNKTEENIKAVLKDICKDMPSEFTDKCTQFVDKYAKAVINFIVLDVSPDEICKALSLCASDVKQLPKPVHVKILKDVKGSFGNTECEVCKIVMKVVDTFLGENRTEASIREVLDKVCRALPDTISSECEQLVQTYGDKLIQLLLQNLDPDTICKEITLCPAQVKEIEGSLKSKAGPACGICEFVIKEIDVYLNGNRSVAAITSALEKVCSIMPDTLTAECREFVDTYGKVIVSLLVQNIDPKTICTRIGLCAEEIAATVGKNLPDIVPGDLKANPVTCEICKTVMGYLDTLLKKNATEAEVKEALDQVCGFLPSSYKDECTTFVNEYTDEIIKYIVSGVTPNQVCSLIGLCSSAKNSLLGAFIIPEEQKGSSKLKASAACVVCEFALKEIDTFLKGNRSEAAIQSALDKVCSILPDTLTTECEDFVNKYSPVIINLLVQNIDPKTICTRIGLCTAKTITLGETKSPLGSSKLKASAACVVCEFALKEIDTFLKGNRSEAAIQSALDKVCSILPDTLTTECEDFVNKYSPVIINLLIQNIDPKTICTRIGLCTAKTITLGETKSPLVHLGKGSLTKSEKCQICELVMNSLDSILKEKATEAEIQKALDEVCGLLPSTLKDQCTAFVDEYTDLVVSLIANGLKPDEVCSVLTLCSSGKESPWGTFVKILPGKQKAKSDFCVPCKFLITQLEQFVQENRTAEEIEQYMRKLCNILPDTVTAQCHDVVDQYIPAILALIGQNLKPEEICQQLGFCNATVTHNKDDKNTLFFKPQKLGGTNKCTYGPAYWCANKDNAVKCNAMVFCTKHVWN